MTPMCSTTCPHGDPTCPCPDGDSCHYEGTDAMICPNPVLDIKGLTNAHCHIEGCGWHVKGCSPDRPVGGECGLSKLGHQQVIVGGLPTIVIGAVDWACGKRRSAAYNYPGPIYVGRER